MSFLKPNMDWKHWNLHCKRSKESNPKNNLSFFRKRSCKKNMKVSCSSFKVKSKKTKKNSKKQSRSTNSEKHVRIITEADSKLREARQRHNKAGDGLSPIDIVTEIVTKPPPRLPDGCLDPQLTTLINRCLTKDPQRRPSAQVSQRHALVIGFDVVG